MRRFLVVFSMVFSLCAQTNLPRDPEGWTVFTPSEDSRIAYVDASGGDDQSARVYTADSAAVGTDPFLPGGPLRVFRTIAAAFDAVRDGHPDWVLLKRGEVWYESGMVRNGRSDAEPFLFSSYGPGESRPLLKTGAESGLNRCCKSTNNFAAVDIACYAHTRNPDSPEYVSGEGSTGFNLFCGEGYVARGYLIEGCLFRFYTGNVIQGPGTLEDIIVRRNVIVDNYSTTAHSQGLYTNNVSMVLEGNVFDHNGWYRQQIDDGNEKADGLATMFNHNTYFCNSKGVTFRENIFLRPSSMGNKWTANDGQGSAHDITIENNLYVDGEIGIGIGGNKTDPPYRFKNIAIRRNVVLDIGRSRPTNRTLGWGLDINDWDGGEVTGNVFAHQVDPGVTNVRALKIEGETRNVTIRDNVIHDLRSHSPLVVFRDGTTSEGIVFSDNDIQCPGLNVCLMRMPAVLAGYDFSDNAYFSARDESEWFRIDGNSLGFADWRARSAETGGSAGRISYADPDRTVEKYNGVQGGDESMEGFVGRVREQGRGTWRTAYTAPAINDWIREGFGIPTRSVSPRVRSQGPGNPQNSTVWYTIRGRCLGSRNSVRTRTGVVASRTGRMIVVGNLPQRH